MKKALELIDFTKKYQGKKSPTISDANFSVTTGSFHGLIGANGSGKTTMIKSIIGAIVNYEGEIKIDGISNKELNAKSQIGYIPERANFPNGFTAKSYLYHMAKLAGIKKEEANKFVQETLKELNMQNLSKDKPDTFSSGQKKKILLAQALVHNPKILIMDEPAANLDPIARKSFFDSLMELKQKGITIFISSHILAELDQYVDSVTILDEGKVAYSGLTKDIEGKKTLIIEFNNKKDAKIALENIGKFSGTINANNIEVEMTDKSTKAEDIIKNIIKKVIPSSYYVKDWTLQSIYDKYVIKGSVDTQEKTNRKKWYEKLL